MQAQAVQAAQQQQQQEQPDKEGPAMGAYSKREAHLQV
jgi:hypothetical protein